MKPEDNPYIVFLVMQREGCTYDEARVHIFEARMINKEESEKPNSNDKL